MLMGNFADFFERKIMDYPLYFALRKLGHSPLSSAKKASTPRTVQK